MQITLNYTTPIIVCYHKRISIFFFFFTSCNVLWVNEYLLSPFLLLSISFINPALSKLYKCPFKWFVASSLFEGRVASNTLYWNSIPITDATLSTRPSEGASLKEINFA